MAYTTASSSSSIVAYLDFASERNRDPACMRIHSSDDFCWRMNPTPCLLASVLGHVGLVRSKKDRTGNMIKEVLGIRKSFIMIACPQKIISGA